MLAAFMTAGCASYAPRPITPESTAAALERRTLGEPRLMQFITAASPTYVGGTTGWDVSTLTLAAIYYHPEIELSRTRLAVARAGIKTAGQIPNPTLTLAPGNGILATEAPAALTLGILITFVIETFGKREARVEKAQNLAEAARQDLATAAWQVRGGVRTALLEIWAAEGRLRLAERRRGLQEQIVALLERSGGSPPATARRSTWHASGSISARRHWRRAMPSDRARRRVPALPRRSASRYAPSTRSARASAPSTIRPSYPMSAR